jgi:hypothetical protein
MAFRIRKDARDKWFRHLRVPTMQLGLDFDVYYFCLMAGLAAKRKHAASQDDTTDLVQGFPQVYREKGRIIVGLFLRRELDALGIDLNEKVAVHNAIRQYVSPVSASYLSDEGEREINKYAHGGLDEIAEWFGEPPRTLEFFLPMFHSKLAECLARNR